MLARLVVIGILVARPALAAPACDPDEAPRLRAQLEDQQRKADQWGLAWKITFTTAAVGSLAVAIADPAPDLRDSFYVAGAKATIAATSRFLLPLRVHLPAATGDACADDVALRREALAFGRRERKLFFFGHLGGIALNLAGGAILWKTDSLGKGLLSLTGLVVGLVNVYTMPRGGWHLARAHPEWTVGMVPHDRGWVLAAGAAF